MKTILIVGAGTSGLTAAVELARQGYSCDIIDKKPTPSSLSRAVGILPSSMAIFSHSTVANEIQKQAIEIEHVNVSYKDKKILKLKINILPGKNNRLYALAQNKTEEVLMNCLKNFGVSVQYSTELQDISETEEGVCVKVNDQEKYYDLVIAADGAKSFIRTRLNIKFLGYDLDKSWSIADVNTTNEAEKNRMNISFDKHFHTFLTVPLEQSRVRVVANTEDVLKKLAIPLDIQSVNRSASFHISIRQAESYSQGSIFLIGDAAHTHSPVGGRGMNLGIADAFNLVQKITKGQLEDYQLERHQAGKKVLEFTEKLRRFFENRSIYTKIIVFSMINLLAKIPFLHRAIVRRLLKL
jgi:2-polyprenyl-6-methoxyphenol hydroxylase-like FAD-dependent oxidoreductase